MLRILLLAAIFAGCTPSPQDIAMRRTDLDPTAPTGSNETLREGRDAPVASRAGRNAGDRGHAAPGPIPAPVSAAANPAPAPPPAPPIQDSPAEARGRRILSTAFVMAGPDGRLSVELHDGRVLVLRDVTMHARDYRGTGVAGLPSGARYRGGYADVAAARPGGAEAPEPEPVPGPAAPSRRVAPRPR